MPPGELTKELLRHPFSEGLVSDFQAHRVGCFRILASNIAKLVLAVRGRFINDFRDLIGRGIGRHLFRARITFMTLSTRASYTSWFPVSKMVVGAAGLESATS